MRTIHTLATSAVALLGLVFFGTANLAQAGHPIGSGKAMGHGPVVNNSGKIGKEMGHGPAVNPRGKDHNWDKDRKWDKDWNKDWNRYSYRYGYRSYCFATEECVQPVCEVPVVAETPCGAPVCEEPVCPQPVVVPTPCCEPVCGCETYRSYDSRKPCYDDYYRRHREHSQDKSKPTTASSHRNTENLGSMAQHVSGGKGRR